MMILANEHLAWHVLQEAGRLRSTQLAPPHFIGRKQHPHHALVGFVETLLYGKVIGDRIIVDLMMTLRFFFIGDHYASFAL